MKGWEILAAWAAKGKVLSASTIYGYARSGYITKPEGPINSLQSDYIKSAPAEIYAVRMLLPILGPSTFKLVREIGLHILGAHFVKAWDVSGDPVLVGMIKNRQGPAFYASDYITFYCEFQESQPPVDLLALRIALITLATPTVGELERAKAEYNARDISAIEERRAALEEKVPPVESRKVEKAEKTIFPRAARVPKGKI